MRALPALLLVASLQAASCGRATPPELSGEWRVTQIEWSQNDQRVRLTAEGELHIGRLQLPQRPRSFADMIQAMNTVTVEVEQAGRAISGSLQATADAPSHLLRQIGAAPGSIIARFAGDMVNDTLGTVKIETPDGRRREIVFRVEERGRRVVAQAVPVFGESEADAGDVLLLPVH